MTSPLVTSIGNSNAGLTYREAAASPCGGCAPTPCCTHMPLQMLQITDLPLLDYMGYLLGFEGIEVGVGRDGLWRVFYEGPCGFLSPEDGSCTVYRTPRQPNVCTTYDPYRCWYRGNLAGGGSPEYLRLNEVRLEHLRSRMVFGEDRRLVGAPPWETLAAELSALPYDPASRAAHPGATLVSETDGDEPAPADPIAAASASSPPLRTFRDLQQPCRGCSAHCCRSLLFPQAQPVNAAQLDQLRFYLGFPGVELALGEDGWTLVVHTTCRYLEENRCSLFGQPERPLYCTLYDAWGCAFKALLGTPPAQDAPRVGLEAFEAVLDLFAFDTHTAIVRFPAYVEIRRAVEGVKGARGGGEKLTPGPGTAS